MTLKALFSKNALTRHFARFELKLSISRQIDKVYYPVRDFFFPWNVVKLKGITRSWHDTDIRMEEAIMQLLSDYFDGEQPFHDGKYEKRPTLERHRELLRGRQDDMDPEKYAIFERLLEILEWYRNGGLKVTGDGIFIATSMSGQPPEECKRLMQEFDAQIDERLTFVVRHRHYLWT